MPVQLDICGTGCGTVMMSAMGCWVPVLFSGGEWAGAGCVGWARAQCMRKLASVV